MFVSEMPKSKRRVLQVFTTIYHNYSKGGAI